MEKITIVGQTNFRGQKRSFGIYPDDRRRHIYAIGKTGSGKTTLLENMIAQDIAAGHGVGVVDPHGDMAERLLDAVPPQRINDVVYFDPSDVEYPIGFNVLETIDPSYKYLVASGLVSSLKKIWADSWGPRLEYILRNTILALLDYPASTMLGIMRMLSDKEYRKKVIAKISDPVIKSFWVNEFSNYNEKFRSEAISPIQNKVGQFLSSAIIRNIVAQPKSTIDMHDIMDNGKVLLLNVSKGKIGEDNSALLGAMLITKIQLAAMDRAKMPEEQRRDFYLYVDEFQNFATESFATILSEARKYRLNLTIAHQYITQMEEVVRDAVFGNVGTMVSFRVGAFDAEYLEKEYAPAFTQTDLVNLPKFNAYIKLMINGMSSKPFSMQTLPPISEQFGRRQTVLEVSRERYGQPRAQVEDKIARWSGVAFKGNATEEVRHDDRRTFDQPRTFTRQREFTPAKFTPPSRAPKSPLPESTLTDVVVAPANPPIRNLEALLSTPLKTGGSKTDTSVSGLPRKMAFPISCARCGRAAEVPFKPLPGKPVYCKECFEIIKQQSRPPAGGGVVSSPVNTATVTPRPVKAAFRGPIPPPVRR